MADMIMIDKDDLNWALVTLNYLNNNDGDISEQEPEIHEEIRREIERMSKKYLTDDSVSEAINEVLAPLNDRSKEVIESIKKTENIERRVKFRKRYLSDNQQ